MGDVIEPIARQALVPNDAARWREGLEIETLDHRMDDVAPTEDVRVDELGAFDLEGTMAIKNDPK